MRRLPLFVAAAVVVLPLSLTGCSSSDPKAAPSAPVKIVAFLRDAITDDERRTLDQDVRGMPGLREVSFETKQQAYDKFKKEFQDIDPDMVAQTKPDSLPESYVATVTTDTLVEPIETLLIGTDGVASVTVTPTGVTPLTTLGTIVQIPQGLNGDERTVIEKAIRALPNAGEPRFEDGDAAYARLVKACRDQPKVAAALRPDLALASYRFTFTLASGSDAAPPAFRLSPILGVVSVLTVPASVL